MLSVKFTSSQVVQESTLTVVTDPSGKVSGNAISDFCFILRHSIKLGGYDRVCGEFFKPRNIFRCKSVL